MKIYKLKQDNTFVGFIGTRPTKEGKFPDSTKKEIVSQLNITFPEGFNPFKMAKVTQTDSIHFLQFESKHCEKPPTEFQEFSGSLLDLVNKFLSSEKMKETTEKVKQALLGLIKAGDIDMIQKLVEEALNHGINLGVTPLMIAALTNDVEAFKAATGSLYSKDVLGNTFATYLAIGTLSTAMLKPVLDKCDGDQEEYRTVMAPYYRIRNQKMMERFRCF